MNKIYILAAVLSAIFLSSCISDKIAADDINPYQKKAEILIENDNYKRTLHQIDFLSKKYEGFIKRSALHYDENNNRTAEFELHVPFKYFYDFLTEFHGDFENQILEERISTEKSMSRLYFSNNLQIEEKKKRLTALYNTLNYSRDIDDKVVAQTEIDRLEAEIENNNQKRLSLVESMNYSTFIINWKEPSKEKEQRKTVIIDMGYSPTGEAVPGLSNTEPLREIIFDKFGQVESFGVGEPVDVRLNGIEKENTNIIAKYNLDENTVELKTVDRQRPGIIYLDRKCQIVTVGLGPLPEIIRGEEVMNEQIIITPLVDDNCFVTGFEIRAGTIESGCTQGRTALARLKKCMKKQSARSSAGTVRVQQQRTNETQSEAHNDWFYQIPID